MNNSNSRAKRGWSDRKIQKYLNETLSLNQYCRDGYLILGRYAGETTQRIRGECKDKANQQDLERFPNTILRW